MITEREMMRLRRKRARITLTELAEHLRCSASLISKYENSITDMSPDKELGYKAYINQRSR